MAHKPAGWCDTHVHACYLFTLAAGMPGAAPGQAPQQSQKPATAIPFPPVLKNEQPSDHILKYMDGLSKRALKLTET